VSLLRRPPRRAGGRMARRGCLAGARAPMGDVWLALHRAFGGVARLHGVSTV